MRSLRETIEAVRGRLIDLSLRNRLLNTNLEAKTGSGVRLASPDCTSFFERCWLQKLPVEIRARITDDAAELLGELDGGSKAARDDHSESRAAAFLRSEFEVKALRSRMQSLHRDTREREQEQGINTLFVALGFLEWCEAESSEQIRYAPVVLLPVEIRIEPNSDKFVILARDEELHTNPSLRLFIEKQFGLVLPESTDSEDFHLTKYFDEIELAIKSRANWRLSRTDLLLGSFSFDKFILWRDLAIDSVEKEQLLQSNSILRDLLSSPDDAVSREAPLEFEGKFLDAFFKPSDLNYVLDADGSQTEAIQTALSGRNMVIQGPPGTGKSQTITNLIVSAVLAGKKVLFVSEKIEALNVVKDRLSNADCSALCLELHSRKISKSAVLSQLNESLEFSDDHRGESSDLEHLEHSQLLLNTYHDDISRTVAPFGYSHYELSGLLLLKEKRIKGNRHYKIPDAREFTKKTLESKLSELRELQSHLVSEGPPACHPCRFFKLRRLTRGQLSDLSDKLKNSLSFLQNTILLRDQVADAFRQRGFDSYIEAAQIEDVLRMVRAWPEDYYEFAAHLDQGDDVKTPVGELQALLVQLNSVWQRRKRYEETLSRGWEEFPVLRVLEVISASKGRLADVFSGPHQRAKEALRRLTRDKAPKTNAGLLSFLQELESYFSDVQRLQAFTIECGWVIAGLWRGIDTNELKVRERIIALEAFGSLPDDGKALCQKLSQDKELRAFLSRISTELFQDSSSPAYVGDLADALEPGFFELSVEERLAALRGLIDNIELYNDWFVLKDLLNQQQATLGEDLYRDIVNGDIEYGLLVATFEFSVLTEIKESMSEMNPAIDRYDSILMTEARKQFKKLDTERLSHSRGVISDWYLKKIQLVPEKDLRIVRGEIVKKRNRLPVRKLVASLGDSLQLLKPIALMSPISLVQFIPLGTISFDLLIVDEASQVKPEDLIGAMLRVKQVVVVGDSQQLPPTDFFNRVITESDSELKLDDDGSFVLGNVESILDLCRASFSTEVMLRWHYRSRHPSLIAVSNKHFYGERLFYPPSAFETNDGESFGVSMRKTPSNCYTRGGSNGGQNIVEGEIIVDEVISFAQRFPEKTLGVVTFSVTQRDVIRDLLDKKLRAHSGIDSFFCEDRRESFFVRNLETIQGDERDVIFISLGYGRTADGSLHQNFGPLTTEGGDRRLNVMITRARERMVVFASLTSEDISLDTGKRGVRALKEFLQLAEKGYMDVPSATSRPFGSPFEEYVSEFLVSQGYEVESQVGMSGFFIDLAIRDPLDRNRYLCGIECDGAPYHSSRTARERDRLRQEILESRGWTIYRIWSTDWFRRRKSQEAKLLSYLEALRAEQRVTA